MISHDLRSTATNQIVLDQRDLSSTPEFERAMDRRCQVLVSNLETLDTITVPRRGRSIKARQLVFQS